MRPGAATRILLVGAGHAHVEVLRQAALRPSPSLRWVLVVDRNPTHYSGMLPGLVAGRYRPADLAIDAVALARRAGAELVLEAVRRVEPDQHRLVTDSGRELAYDVASLDVGAGVAGGELPGVREHALAVRPIARFVADLAERIARAAPHGAPFRLLVVGAGAGGVELAFCGEARLRAETGRAPEVALVESAETILPGAPASLARRVARAACRRGIRLELGARVAALEAGAARLVDGRRLPADAVIWATGPSAYLFLGESGLPVDAGGFVRVRPTFQVEGAASLFAAGDCASLAGMAKAGVYAVRAGPVLAENLRRFAEGRPLRAYRPQRAFLSLLDLGDGTAIGARGRASFEGRWVMRLKQRIDRTFVARYR